MKGNKYFSAKDIERISKWIKDGFNSNIGLKTTWTVEMAESLRTYSKMDWEEEIKKHIDDNIL